MFVIQIASFADSVAPFSIWYVASANATMVMGCEVLGEGTQCGASEICFNITGVEQL